MFHNLGVAWAGSLLGFLAIAFLPIPFLFYTFGERLRKLSKHEPTEFAIKPQNDEESKSEERGHMNPLSNEGDINSTM